MRPFNGLVTSSNALFLLGKSRIISLTADSQNVSGLASASQETLFCYTSGRWLYNEQRQLDLRYVRFDVEGLCKTAGDVLGAPCTQITKLRGGLYNKVFSLKTDAGEELLARIPNPNAGSSRVVIASEVATLDFLRNGLDIPVPEVVAWSSPSQHPNLVGAEYILMKRMPGQQLSDVWDGMTQAQRFELVRSLVAIEAKLVAAKMSGYGSLYYRETYPDGISLDGMLPSSWSTAKSFVLGPSTDRRFWVDGRGALDLDRGPWASAAEYFSAVAKREIECIRTSAINEPSLMDFGRKATAREAHIHLLNQFLIVLPHILPHLPFCCPVLLHQDLHLDNIFVDSTDPTKISGIIDWQSTTSAPLFMQARFPSVFDCDDPYPWGAVLPELPDDFDSLSKNAKIKAREQLERVRLKKFYEMAARKFNPAIPRAMEALLNKNDDDPVSYIFPLLEQTAVDGPLPLQELLIEIFERWDEICKRHGSRSGFPCPISYSQAEISRFRELVQEYAVALCEFTGYLAQVGGGRDGWVSNGEFENAMRVFDEHRDELERLRRRVDDILFVL
ncbi:predicted protein [Uncinocarpus reesii 1704]|uniref:Altered inheritance of mitochondria protein 9, mitochondrial n=1 Tax=Uncinocarpus reesii (strain UAMH 1704) TaxID=336963 RepID=C4JRL1_UNCRE|nr:uncharacterized protein UREG_05100 [Uncinocarpus reesii 1704]EEP80258.1 predicted protein [Uncinocarpus reesii 1704]